jgi:hypothetical protein
MKEKYGFEDGATFPPGVEIYRDVYVKAINHQAKQTGSDQRIVPYNRPGVHNLYMVWLVTKEWFDTVFLPRQQEGEMWGTAECEELDINGTDIDSVMDDAMKMAIQIAYGLNLDSYISTKVRVDPKFEEVFESEIAVCGTDSHLMFFLKTPVKEPVKPPLFHPNGLSALRYAGYHPSDTYGEEVAAVILTKTWLNQRNAELTHAKPVDWVRHNWDIMNAYERSISDDAPNHLLIEGLQYPCELCTAITTLRDAHLFSLDSFGLPNDDGFPQDVCGDCAQKAIGETE